VFFHSNLAQLAPARELVKLPNTGADAVIDGFLKAVGPTGTVAAPTLTATFPEGQGPSGKVFDPKETPSRVGSITDLFWRRPTAVRSHHPTHCVAAIGRLAAEYTAGHELVATFDWDSPYGRTVRWDGYICYFGTSTNTNTHIHAVEQWMELPYLEESVALVRGINGETLKVKTYGAPPGPRDFYRKDTSLVHEVLAKSGIWKQGKVGRATVTLMKARDCFDVVFRGIIAKPDLLLNVENDPWTAKYRQATIDHVRARWGGPA
jgi:aminoglycoside 3-N-acetyltransferase